MDYNYVIITGSKMSGKTTWMNETLNFNFGKYYYSNDIRLRKYCFVEFEKMAFYEKYPELIKLFNKTKFIIVILGPLEDVLIASDWIRLIKECNNTNIPILFYKNKIDKLAKCPDIGYDNPNLMSVHARINITKPLEDILNHITGKVDSQKTAENVPAPV